MDKFLALSVTYGDLERALLELNFSLTIAEPHRLYYYYNDDAKESFFGFALSISLDQKVRPAHLSSVRHAVVAMGVSDEETFRRLLTVPHLDTGASYPASANSHAPRSSRSVKSHVLPPPVPAEVH